MLTRVLSLVFALAWCFSASVVAAGAAPAADPAKPEVAAGDPDAQFAEFLKNPTEETFRKAQKAVTASAAYSPYSTDLDDIDELMTQGKYQEAKVKLASSMPNLLLSPRAHMFASTIARKLGDEDTAGKEGAIFLKCIQGLLSTGDGSEKRPIVVTRVSDEYDVTRSLKKRVSGQGLRLKDDKSYDVLQCSGGTEMWFDITAPFAAMRKAMEQRKPPKKDPATRPGDKQ